MPIVKLWQLLEHKSKTPIDHPDSSVTRAKLEYPTVNVSFAYLAAIDQVLFCSERAYGCCVLARTTFTDKAAFGACQVNMCPEIVGRVVDKANFYVSVYNPTSSTADHELAKSVAGAWTRIATEAIDIDYSGRGLMLSCSGSSIKSMRFELPVPRDPLSLPPPNYTISVTDTSFASGRFGYRTSAPTAPHGSCLPDSVYLKPPASEVLRAIAIIETETIGDGSYESPFRPSMSEDLVDVSELQSIPDFLKLEKRKYDMLKAKGFTEEEMNVLLGYVPQHQVNLNSVSWGAFEFSEKSPTNIIVVSSDNPYSPGAVDRQIESARKKRLRTLRSPRDYGEAVSQYNTLRRDFEHWLAGKDNYAYQALGWGELELFAAADFYHGELLEHKTHYEQLRQVQSIELENTLKTLIEKLEKVEVLKKGW